MADSVPGAPSVAGRALGAVGVLGGLGLLAAFVVDIPSAWNTVRLVLFAAGAIAVAAAAYGSHAAASRSLALAGDFGLIGFWVGLAFWLADAWFGIVALRLGVLWRWAAVALVVGSLLAILGMDRLGLTSGANPTVFGPVSLAGILLAGIAWVLLGLELAAPRLRGVRASAMAGVPKP